MHPTPLVRIELDPGEPVWCKLEYLNPSGSTKDRVARHVLDHAIASGRLKPGDLVIEASSGSTAIAFALACAQRGLRFLAVMPEGVSNERLLMIRAFGGAVHSTVKAGGVSDAIAEAERLAIEQRAFAAGQFSNPLNSEAHRNETAREALDQLPNIDAVVSGVGTGGTLMGLHAGIRERCPNVTPVYARPVDYLTSDPECCSFSARIPGVVDCASKLFREEDLPGLETVEVPAAEAIATARRLIAKGFPVGPSSGLNFCAAAATVRKLGPDARVLTVFPDRMEHPPRRGPAVLAA